VLWLAAFVCLPLCARGLQLGAAHTAGALFVPRMAACLLYRTSVACRGQIGLVKDLLPARLMDDSSMISEIKDTVAGLAVPT
jgi:hypothetical protein